VHAVQTTTTTTTTHASSPTCAVHHTIIAVYRRWTVDDDDEGGKCARVQLAIAAETGTTPEQNAPQWRTAARRRL